MINRDISWLSFNERVLQEAQDQSVPLIERMRFLGIYSNNLDEFFRVRVATVLRLKKALSSSDSERALHTAEILEDIQKKVMALQAKFYSSYEQILLELQNHNIFIKNENDLNEEQEIFVREYFLEKIESSITPIILDNLAKFPYLKDKSVYLFISFLKKGNKRQYAVIELPTDEISRFLVLPSSSDEQNVIYLDDVIRYNMKYILSIFEPTNIESYIIKLTRDSELDLDDDFSESYYEKITKSLKSRKKGKVVRLVYDRETPKEYVDFIKHNIKLNQTTNLIPGGRYHNFRDFMSFPSLDRPDLCFEKAPVLEHKNLVAEASIIKQVEKQDLLFQFPYHPFDYVIDIIREAAIDPKVVGIKISLYRVAPKSKVIKALKNAARNGKQVYVVIELRARFDEEANLEWSKSLKEDNIQIEFGIKGLKVHSKLLLIQRKQKGKIKNYALISTGNFHEKTAKIYGDTAYFTADERITKDVVRIFEIFDKPYMPYEFGSLLVAPINLRSGIYQRIHNEIEKVKNGSNGRILIKVNNLVDEGVINALLEAANVGVKIRLIVRGVCSLMPMENIEVRSIVGRFLEHSRIFWFGDVDGEIFLGSADLMTRNLDVRIETLTPLFDPKIKADVIDYLNLQWSDNQNSRVIDAEMKNRMFTNSSKPVHAHLDMYDLLRK